VCGAACRASRDRKLARARRRRELDEARSDERRRQQQHREKQRRAGAKGAPERSSAQSHAPASRPKPSIFRKELAEILDRALGLSRASLMRDLREFAGAADKNVASVAAVTHELQSRTAPFS
jgi:hypothetical protein